MITTPKVQRLLIPTKDQIWYVAIWRWLTWPKKWIVTEDWYFTLPNGIVICVPTGFVFDGASIPRPLWWILSPMGLLMIPGIIHDFAYRYDYLLACVDGERVKYNQHAGQAHWDRLFKQVGKSVNGINFIDYIAWLMLVAFGWIAWRKNRKLNAPDIMPGVVS